MSKSWKKLIVGVALAGGLSSGALADGYEPVGKGFVAPPAYLWTGFYVGGNIGAAAFDSEAQDDAELTSYGYTNNDGFGVIGGLKAGYDQQFGNALVGIVGEYSWTSLDESYRYDYCSPTIRSTEIDGIGSVRGRAGLAVGNALAYVTGGVAWIDRDDRLLCNDASDDNSFISDETVTALVVGGGAEMFVAKQVTVGLEYLYYEAEDDRVRANNEDDFAGFDMTLQTLTFNVNYRF